VVIHGSGPAAFAPLWGITTARASIPTASNVLANLVALVDVDIWGRASLDAQKDSQEVIAISLPK
jgi:hypothetical protein